jgi:hypothetical protein
MQGFLYTAFLWVIRWKNLQFVFTSNDPSSTGNRSPAQPSWPWETVRHALPGTQAWACRFEQQLRLRWPFDNKLMESFEKINKSCKDISWNTSGTFAFAIFCFNVLTICFGSSWRYSLTYCFCHTLKHTKMLINLLYCDSHCSWKRPHFLHIDQNPLSFFCITIVLTCSLHEP